MDAGVRRSAGQDPRSVACSSAEGCSYLRALSAIEHVAGFERGARAYGLAAHRCCEHGCQAALGRGGEPAPVLAAAASVVPLNAARATGPDQRVGGDAVGEAVPFSRAAHIDIASDRDGNYVERRLLKFDTLPKRSDPLGYLYRYWRDLRAITQCRVSDIDTVHLQRAGIIGKLHLVNVSSSDPGDFRFELFGYAVPIGRYQTPQAHPVAIYSDSTIRDYNTARMTAAPRLQRIRSRIGDIGYHYTRLILPFLGKNGRVTHLAVAIRQEPGDGLKIQACN